MRRLILGVDAQGRSAVLADGEPPNVTRFSSIAEGDDVLAARPLADSVETRTPSAGDVIVEELWRAGSGASIPARAGRFSDPTLANDSGGFLALNPGENRWHIVHYGPHYAAPSHQTETVDHGLVLSGEIDLILETGVQRLRQGDSYVLCGISHGWRTFETPCTVSILLVGATRR